MTTRKIAGHAGVTDAPDRPPESVSQQVFARRSGLSRTAVQRHLAAGRIKADGDGKIPLAAGLEAAAAILAEREAERKERAAAPIVRGKLADARARKETALADMRELRLARERGELVPVAEVDADARRAMTVIREQLLAIPSRVSSQIEAAIAKGGETRAAVIEALVADEVNRALETLHATRFGSAP